MLVVGAGAVATRRIERLLDSGAAVTVVAPSVAGAVRDWADAGRLRLFERVFDPTDVEGHALVFACTDVPAINTDVATAERRLKQAIDIAWPSMEKRGLAPTADSGAWHVTADLADALAGADLVQENVPERTALKQHVLAEIDALVPKDVLIG